MLSGGGESKVKELFEYRRKTIEIILRFSVSAFKQRDNTNKNNIDLNRDYENKLKSSKLF